MSLFLYKSVLLNLWHRNNNFEWCLIDTPADGFNVFQPPLSELPGGVVCTSTLHIPPYLSFEFSKAVIQLKYWAQFLKSHHFCVYSAIRCRSFQPFVFPIPTDEKNQPKNILGDAQLFLDTIGFSSHPILRNGIIQNKHTQLNFESLMLQFTTGEVKAAVGKKKAQYSEAEILSFASKQDWKGAWDWQTDCAGRYEICKPIITEILETVPKNSDTLIFSFNFALMFRVPYFFVFPISAHYVGGFISCLEGDRLV